jgi:transcriptional regulator with XRE-family HTH domain
MAQRLHRFTSGVMYNLSVMSNAAQLVRATRVRAGITQAELGRRLGMSQAAVARLERPGANPTVATLDRLMHATGHRLEMTAAENGASVDESLIAANLRLSPAERLTRFTSWNRNVAQLARAARVAGDGTG